MLHFFSQFGQRDAVQKEVPKLAHLIMSNRENCGNQQDENSSMEPNAESSSAVLAACSFSLYVEVMPLKHGSYCVKISLPHIRNPSGPPFLYKVGAEHWERLCRRWWKKKYAANDNKATESKHATGIDLPNNVDSENSANIRHLDNDADLKILDIF